MLDEQVSNSKKRRAEANLPSRGDNADKLLKDYVAFVAEKRAAIDSINSEIKDKLNEAKNDGFLKTAIRNAVKNLRMTEEQLQAKREVDSETTRITELCKDLALFAHAEKAAA